MTRTLLPCGTPGGYARHRRRGEPVDRACLDARRAYQRRWRASREKAMRELVARHRAEFRSLLYAAMGADAGGAR